MIDLLAFGVVMLAGLYLIGLAIVAFTAPPLATRFLLGHAGTALLHYFELLIRLVVGAALVVHAPSMRFPTVFFAFGWVLVTTTIVLVAVPWEWHQRFAQRSVHQAVRHLRLIAVASLAFGSLVIVAASLGPP